MNDVIRVTRATQHNLKDVSVDIPRGKLVVITGPSGSGKSSLAFDTIYAEGQRRYVESLSAYARQFLEQLAKPAVESIEGLSPAIALQQKPLTRSPRSTVGTVTEIADYLRLLFARAGTAHCPNCDQVIVAQSATQITETLLKQPDGTKAILFAPIARKQQDISKELEDLRRAGFVRARVDNELVDLGGYEPKIKRAGYDLDVVIDRLVIREGVRTRLADSIELALKHGQGSILVQENDAEPYWRSEKLACLQCNITLPEVAPRCFSFNSPAGACPACDGLGEADETSAEMVVGDPRLSLREGVILPWGERGSTSLAFEVARAVKATGVDASKPWQALSASEQGRILWGPIDTETLGAGKRGRVSHTRSTKNSGGAKDEYLGVIPELRERYRREALESESESSDEASDAEPTNLRAFFFAAACQACNGKRLRPESLAFRLHTKSRKRHDQRNRVIRSPISVECLSPICARYWPKSTFPKIVAKLQNRWCERSWTACSF
jgi:excinuclease ABC subunit A